jgi:hypothetical protein
VIGRARTGNDVERTASQRAIFAAQRPAGYHRIMSSERSSETEAVLWGPHPDDEIEVGEAIAAAERGELLSPEASEAFIRWLEGEEDESWRDELA